MTFAGVRTPQDRADFIAFLNQHSDSPLPLPKAPEAAPAAAGTEPGAGPGNGPQKAENEPVLNVSEAGKTRQTSGGAGSPPAPGTPQTR
jgi:cytochrome c